MSRLKSSNRVEPIEEKISEEFKENFSNKDRKLYEIFGKRYGGFYRQLKILIETKYKGDVNEFLSVNKDKEEMVEFQFEAFDKAKSDEKVKLDKLAYTEDVRGIKCHNCGSNFTGSENRQFRSLDEGSTTRFFCNNCANRPK